MERRQYILIVVLSICFKLFGQIDTISVPIIELSSKRIVDHPFVDSFEVGPMASINVLREKSNIYLKTYGPSGVSTLTIRGGSASQTQLFWEGVPLNNSMLGLTDFSLIPVQLFNEILIKKEGSSVEDGNGAMAGGVFISNKNSEANFLSLGYGSYDNYKVSGSLNTQIQRMKLDLKGFFNSAKNDYIYSIGSIDKVNENAELSNIVLIPGISYTYSETGTIGINYWFQQTQRNIPPLTTQNESVASVLDTINRLNFYWDLSKTNYKGKFSIAFMDEKNYYTDPNILLESSNNFKRGYAEYKSTIIIHPKIQLLLNADINTLRSNTENYQSFQQFTGGSIAGLVKHYRDKLTIGAGLRSYFDNNGNEVVVPMAELNYRATNSLELKTKVSKEYRPPSLNDLFWSPGGNENLKAESGWEQSIDALFKVKTFQLEVGVYHKKVNDWIIWLPQDLFYFSATNLAKVRAYGFSTSSSYEVVNGNFTHKMMLQYDYTKTFNLSSIETLQILKGEQLIYTPKHQATIVYSLQYKGLHLNLNANYTDGVNGINEDLTNFTLLNLEIGKEISVHKHKLDIGLSIHNVMNENYRIVERRVMPGRNYEILVKFNF